MTRRQFLAVTASSLTAFSQQQRYNVLFIAVDDLRPELGCYGHPAVKSPNLDRLAREGILFTRAYCQQAVCSPSRTSLLTGRRPDTTRVYELQTHFRKHLPDVITLPQHFKNNGYVTSGFSKIFHGGGGGNGGLNDARSWSIPAWFPGGRDWDTPENAAMADKREKELEAAGWVWPPGGRAGSNPKKIPSWEGPDVPDEAFADGQTARVAIGALRKLKDKPFFLAVGFLKPHLPFQAPKKYYELYPLEKVTLSPNPLPPENVPEVAMHNSSELRSYTDIPKQGPVPESKARELVRGYWAATSFMDAQVGKLLDELDRLDLRRKTIVILWGDHGWHLGDHSLWNKHTNFEVATRAAMMISVPGRQAAGRKCSALTEFVDIYPTLAELCGLPLPAGLEGTSFAPLVDDPSRSWKRAAFSQYPRAVRGAGQAMGHSMRTSRYRYTEWTVPGKDFRAVELYDYETDPLGNVNVAANPKNTPLLKQLSAQLQAGWRAARPLKSVSQ
jgi:arylsulfatase A-like enzyme